MNIININNLSNGDKIIINNIPMCVIKNEFIKPGKSIPFNRLILKDLISNKIINRIYKNNTSFKHANIYEIKYLFLYKDKKYYFFISKINFNKLEININIINKNKAKFIYKDIEYKIIFWNKKPIDIIVPDKIILKVVKIINKHCSSIQSNYKLVLLNDNLEIKVPIFIKINDLIKINTKNNEYISRIK